MCNTSLHHRGFNNVMEPFPFSTFHLLRTCNRLMLPGSDAQSYYNFVKENNNSNTIAHLGNPNDYATTIPTPIPTKSPILEVSDTSPLPNDSTDPPDVTEYDGSEINEQTTSAPLTQLPSENEGGAPLFRSNAAPLPGFEYIAPSTHSIQSVADFPLMELNRVGVGVFPGFLHRRPRGEKRPIPEEQKDDKYYERRKRNNEAAKKSRDARKIREDRIAFRAALLEQENSILKAQVMALRDELQTMRQLISTSAAVRSAG